MKPHGPLIPILSLATGIAASYMFGMPWWVGLIPILTALIIYLLLLRASGNPVKAFKIGKWHVAWAVLLFAGIGLVDESINRPFTIEEAFGRSYPEKVECEVTGLLSKTYGDRLDVIIIGTNGAKARIRTGVTDLSAGDLISIPTKYLTEITEDTTEIGRKIAPMLKANGFLYSGRTVPKHLEAIGKSNSLRYWFLDLRENIETRIERSHLAKPTADFLNAILMGDKTGLDEETRLTFARGGAAHILALSGLHMGILAGLLLCILFPIKLAGRYKWIYGIAILLLWTYVFMTGMSYSSVRACIMLTLTFLAIILERKNYAGNALCSACLIILIFDPLALFDAGFQLSVVCVGALIAFANPLNPMGHRNHPILYSVCGALIATMVATAASWVLTSYYFSQIPLMFLPSNLLLLPILPFYLAVTVVFVILLCCGVEVSFLVTILDRGYDFFLWATEKLSGGTEFVVDYQMPLWGVAAWLILLSTAAWWLNRKQISI